MENRPPEQVCLAIAKRITAIRLQRAWSRQELAEHADINVHTLKHFERYGHISLARLIALCDALDIGAEIERLFKPRQRVDVNDWQVNKAASKRQRGRRFTTKQQIKEHDPVY